MSEEELLTDMLGRFPQHDTLAALLTDEMMAARGIGRSEADDEVSYIRFQGMQAVELAHAAELLAAGSAYREMIQAVVVALLDIGDAPTFTLATLPGPSAPALSSVQRPAGLRDPWGVVATVGARWVIGWVRAYEAARRSAPRESKTATRGV